MSTPTTAAHTAAATAAHTSRRAATGADTDTRSLILNVNLQGFGQRPASWRTQDVTGTEVLDAPFWENLGRVAERGLLDSVFFADNPSLGNPNLRPLGLVEPFVVLQTIAAATEHLGLVGTASTSYNDPVELAERLLSLDTISGGRVAWNAVTTYNPAVSGNFGVDSNAPRDERYRRAAEFVELVVALWQSAATGVPVQHDGEFFTEHRRLHVPPSAQGHPVIFQAGGSPQGRELASRVAEGVFAVELLIDPAIEHYRQVTEGTRRFGRTPADVSIIPGLSLVIGSTEEEAWQHFDAQEALAPEGYTRGALGGFLGIDLSELPLDQPIPNHLLNTQIDPATFARSLGYRETVGAWVEQNNTSLGALLRSFGGYGARIVVGTPEQIADSIETWFRSRAADGFNLMIDEFPRGLETFVDEVVPILQARGLFRREYTEKTLRDRYRAARGERS